MTRSGWRAAVLTWALVATIAVADEPRAVRDQTGVQWVLPFRAAAAKAEADGRLLLIKPIAFGTAADGGW